MKKKPQRKSRFGATRYWTIIDKEKVKIEENGERKAVTLIRARANTGQIGIFRMQEWQRLPRVGADV